MIHIARVKDNKDPKKLGRVKVEILPTLQDMPDNLLPWANPIQKYDASNSFEQNIPNENELIIVDVDETWTRFSYDGSRPFSSNEDGSKKASSLIQKTGYLNTDNLPSNLKLLNENLLMFEDHNKNKAGIVFKDGSYILWSGTINTTAGSMFICYKDGDNSTSIKMEKDKVSINGSNLVIEK